jgi:hypothetical protein
MTAAERLDDDLKNRRQIFRLADPEFSKIKVLLKVQEQIIETTCLDLSATGIGVLAPEQAFEGASTGVILEYTLSFDSHSPIQGKAIIANRLSTTLESEQGRLIRLGLRFADNRDDRTPPARQLGRRSQRYFMPAITRPMCLCSDPLWLGDNVAIEIHDFSTHGLSGLVSAKKTVLTEGLRTVFRFGFAHLGTFEVPVRIIYANPTEDPAVYRIGCEFVRRPKPFVQAIESYLDLLLLKERPAQRPNSLMPKTTGCRVLSSWQDIESAKTDINQDLGTAVAFQNPDASLHVALNQNPGDQTNKIFRLTSCDHQRRLSQLHNEEEIATQNFSSVLQISLAEIQDFTKQEQAKALRTLVYLATVLGVDEIGLLAAHEANNDPNKNTVNLGALGILGGQNADRDHTLLVQNVILGRGISFGLWFGSFAPLARHLPRVAALFRGAPLWRRALMVLTHLLGHTSDTRHNVDSLDAKSVDHPKRVK